LLLVNIILNDKVNIQNCRSLHQTFDTLLRSKPKPTLIIRERRFIKIYNALNKDTII